MGYRGSRDAVALLGRVECPSRFQHCRRTSCVHLGLVAMRSVREIRPNTPPRPEWRVEVVGVHGGHQAALARHAPLGSRRVLDNR